MDNQTIFQFFHWYYSAEGNLWKHAQEQAAHLASLGVTQVWLPPAYKSAKGLDEPGYAAYDLYDLGEFDQKGTVRTRWGTVQEYLDCIRVFHEHGIKVLADIVLNHKIGGDEQEKIVVQEVDDDDRTKIISEPYTVDAYTKFYFPGRNKKYSDFVWDSNSFTGICENEKIAMIKNEYSNGQWEDVPEKEFGNYDYLMGNDIEFRNKFVREELKKWGAWYTEKTGIDGYRLDALKHITPDFFPEWLDFLNQHFNKKMLCIGEYWKSDVHQLLNYIEMTNGRIQLFDAPLHFNFHQASVEGESYNLSQIPDNSLTAMRPELSISFVDNHDTQPLQSLQSPVEAWFKPIAYSIILLREQATPCVFYPSIYGAQYVDHSGGEEQYIELKPLSCVETMMKVRKKLSYGKQQDYFDHASTIGWTREGIQEKPNSGCAVVATNGSEGFKHMSMGQQHAGRVMKEACGHRGDTVTLNDKGEADFPVNAGSVSVWVFQEAIADLQ
ncbi:MAG: alpha-amylase [Citrobacter freundii]|nr:MAG: alpha-amylase [Citrobacter freundii]